MTTEPIDELKRFLLGKGPCPQCAKPVDGTIEQCGTHWLNHFEELALARRRMLDAAMGRALGEHMATTAREGLSAWLPDPGSRAFGTDRARPAAWDSPEGVKHDEGKPRWSLLPLRALGAVVDVLEYGAKKYSVHGWKKVERQRYVDAAWRHLVALTNGEKLDAESGLPHTAHAACCLLFILHFDGEKP